MFAYQKAALEALPSKCPACGSKLRWNENKVDLVCTQANCGGQLAERLMAFFNVVKIDMMAGTTVRNLINAGYNDIPKILRMNERDFRKAGLGPKISKKLAQGMSQSLHGVSLATVAHASGLFSNETTALGSTRLEWIIEAVGQDNFLRAPESVLRKKLAKAQGKGIGAETINIFLTGIEKFRKLHAQIADMITEPELASVGLQDVVACFSGFRSAEMEQLVKNNGGKVSSSLSKKVTVLFHSGVTSKYTKAQEYKITCVSEDKAMAWIKKRTGEV